MKSRLASELNRILILSGIAALAGASLNSLWPVVVALAGYIIWHLRQLFELYSWLTQKEHTEPPDSSGLWGDLYTHLEHLFRKEHRAQEELAGIIQRAQSSVNALEDAVLLIDSLGRLEYFNETAEQFLGFRHPQDMNQVLTNLIRDPRLYNYLQKGVFREPLELTSPKDDNRILQYRVTEFGPGDRLIMARDVTRLHKLEQMRKDFVANVSHELKTPLTVLKGYLETLLGSVPDDQTRLRRALSQMNQQSSRMEALINDLLMLSRLESSQPEGAQQAVLLHGLLQRMRDDAQTLSGEKQQQISVDVAPDARLIGNPAELESAFGNLISNAVKYSPAKSEIRIRYWQDERGAHFSVSDNGHGIDPTHIPRLTERFYRPDSSRHSETGGTGLGLAIVKHIMIRHQGRLEIRSEVGKGSTFTCHFPPARLVTKPTAVAG
ncbi:MAG: phosphate regulon sensor histidine kinase PhoR [Alcanivoracaceae bacterium]|jgi:two-component system phosphate regulon sensor histidine kinase PhoR|nr:phosphate regulon sensor histidine kinase PhoR [Alcanivoracaceae bacterium]